MWDTVCKICMEDFSFEGARIWKFSRLHTAKPLAAIANVKQGGNYADRKGRNAAVLLQVRSSICSHLEGLYTCCQV